MKNPRLAALQAIAAVDAGKTAQEAVASAGASLAGTDRALFSDLVYGALRNRMAAQFLLKKVIARPQKLPPAMRIALEMAVYSMLHQNKTPDYAAVNETVKLIKKKFGQTLARVANGALRSLLRLDMNDPHLYGEGPLALSLRHSLPHAIYGLWTAAYGEEAANALLVRSSKRPYTGLRVNMQAQNGKALHDGLLKTPGVQHIGRAGVAFGPGQLPEIILGKELRAWEEEGVLSFQSATSMLILEKLDIPGDVPIWDACAGAGGKTVALLEAGVDIPIASDTSLKRLAMLATQCKRLRLEHPRLFMANAARPPLKQWHGNILADVPCSGLGVLGRRPDIKGRWSAGGTAGLVRLQAEILAGLAALLEPGRELFYVTCTLNPEENERQVERLLAGSPQLELMKIWQTPHDHPWLEGMFGARIKKN